MRKFVDSYTPVTVTRKNSLTTVNKIIITVVLYASSILFYFNDFLAVSSLEYMGEVNILSIPGLILAGATALFLDPDSRKLMLNKFVILYGVAICIYAGLGWVVYKNDLKYILLDSSGLVRGFYYGIFLFRLMVRSYFPKLQLLLFVLFPNLMVLFYTIKNASELGINTSGLSGLDIRVGGYIEHHNWYLLVFMGIAIGVLSRYGRKWGIVTWAMPFFMIYSSGFLSARRYIFVTLPILFICSVLALSYRAPNGFLENKPSFLSIKQLKRVLLWASIFLASILIIELIVNIIQMLQDLDWLVFERFGKISSGDHSTELRFEEAAVAFHSLQDEFEIIFGRGLGATYRSPAQLWYGDNSWWCHISAFTYLLKGGLILFSLFIYLFYVKFPLLFVKALLKPNAFDPGKRTALLTVLPGILAWTALSLTEGRLNLFYAIQWGFALAAYYHFKKHGLRL